MQHTINRLRRHMTVQNGTIVVALLIALGWMIGTVNTLQKNFLYQKQVDELAQNVELEKLRNENEKFKQRYYRSDEYLELSARQHLGKASPGEKLIILPDSRGIVDKPPVQTTAKDPAPSNLNQWMRFLFSTKPQA